MRNFEYFEPETVADVCSLLARHGSACKILAGGTDLLVRMKQGTIVPKCVVNIKRIPGLDGIEKDQNGKLRIGALTSIRTLERSFTTDERLNAISQAAFLLGSPQVRAIATVGGNLCNAAPSADMAPPLIALGATVEIAGSKGNRVLSLDDFFTGPGSTALSNSEMLTHVTVAQPPSHSGVSYEKIGRIKLVDLAVVGAAAWVCLGQEQGDSLCESVRIVLGAVAPTPIRAKRAEAILTGKNVDDALIEEASQAASEEAKPISDVRGSENYRRKMVKVLTARALRNALDKARGSKG